MKNSSSYQFLLKGIVSLMLIGQIWSNTVSYCHWMIDSELTELSHPIDTDAEEEKEKEAKLILESYVLEFNVPKDTSNTLHSEILLPLHHPEVTTPPPEVVLFLS